eukprot:1158721-Pelagomonas_calceolata.AAC.4
MTDIPYGDCFTRPGCHVVCYKWLIICTGPWRPNCVHPSQYECNVLIREVISTEIGTFIALGTLIAHLLRHNRTV